MEWHNTKDGFPPHYGEFIVYHIWNEYGAAVEMATYRREKGKDGFYCYDDDGDWRKITATHWMYTPEPPNDFRSKIDIF